MLARALWPCVLTLSLAASCGDADGDAPQRLRPAARGIDVAGRMHPGPQDRCPVCAMSTHDRKMVSAIELEDGATHYFCGTGCLLRSWLAPDDFLDARGRRVARARTVDYFTGQHVDAAEVRWIAGSDVTGAMGRMIVPVLGDDALATFRERHGGAPEFRLRELDAGLWRRITGLGAGDDERR